jgi:hypothetical protein
MANAAGGAAALCRSVPPASPSRAAVASAVSMRSTAACATPLACSGGERRVSRRAALDAAAGGAAGLVRLARG